MTSSLLFSISLFLSPSRAGWEQVESRLRASPREQADLSPLWSCENTKKWKDRSQNNSFYGQMVSQKPPNYSFYSEMFSQMASNISPTIKWSNVQVVRLPAINQYQSYSENCQRPSVKYVHSNWVPNYPPISYHLRQGYHVCTPPNNIVTNICLRWRNSI